MARNADTDELVRFLVTSLVEDVDAVDIAKTEDAQTVRYDITVAADDVGKIIGRQGRIIKAIRTVARASATSSGHTVEVEVLG